MVKKMVKSKRVKSSSTSDKVWVGLFIGIFLAFALALNYVSVGQGFTGHAVNGIDTSFISDMFTSWETGTLDANILKYIFWVVIAMFVYGGLKFVGIPSNDRRAWVEFIQLGLAVTISFVSIAFIAPEEIYVVLSGYTALGLTLILIIPFAAMLFGSAMLLSYTPRENPVAAVFKILLETLLWVSFTLYSLYYLIFGYSQVDRPNGLVLVTLGIFLTSLVITIFNRAFRRWFGKLGAEVLESRSEMQEEMARAQRNIQRGLTPGAEDFENLYGYSRGSLR